jgi:hypothetical protein
MAKLISPNLEQPSRPSIDTRRPTVLLVAVKRQPSGTQVAQSEKKKKKTTEAISGVHPGHPQQLKRCSHAAALQPHSQLAQHVRHTPHATQGSGLPHAASLTLATALRHLSRLPPTALLV